MVSEEALREKAAAEAALSRLPAAIQRANAAESAGPGVDATESGIARAQHLALLTKPVQLVLLAGGVRMPGRTPLLLLRPAARR